MLSFCVSLFYMLSTVDSIATDAWPRFYKSGESTHPTTMILNNLTYYRQKWQSLQNDDFSQTYSFTMSWDCGAQCSECLTANKFIQVKDDKIISLKTSSLNDNSKLLACEHVNNTLQISEYKSIDELYQMVIDWVQTALSSSDISEYTIHELLLHKTYYFPIAVKLSNREYIGWNIVCFEPNLQESEGNVCDFTMNENVKEYKFWVNKKWQAWLGWSAVFLIVVSCSLGYCINWLKKKKAAKIEAWREKERMEAERREREQREKEKKKKKEMKRKRSRSKDRHNKKHKNEVGDHVYEQVNVKEEDEED